jgi:hypothetical protein
MTMRTDVQEVLDRLKTAQQSRSAIPGSRTSLGLKRAPSRKARVPPPGLPSTIWNSARNFFIQF